MTTAATPLGAVLLTGGSSRRMGRDKATIVVDGATLAARLARMLADVASLAVEVGPGHTSLSCVREEPPGAGPLPAVAAGRRALVAAGLDAPALVVACDLPSVTPALLALLASWPGEKTALPVVDGREQPLLARWSVEDLDAAVALAGAGEASLRLVPSRADADLLHADAWCAVATRESFADLDTEEDLAELERRRPRRPRR